MMRYLLAAEADQIQDLIFRSARLREVVGGSQLLSEFCTDKATTLFNLHSKAQGRFLIHDGGAFRAVFEDDNAAQARKRAEEFGRDLAELYRYCTGGNLTVAPPVEYPGGFKVASEEADKALRQAKSRGRTVPTTTVHLPYLAFCASCGIALAKAYIKRHEDDAAERADYVCHDCHRKFKKARDEEKLRDGEKKDRAEGFVDRFSRAALCANISETLTHC